MRAVTRAEPHNPGLCGGSHAIRRQDWRRGTQDCVLHLKAWHARLRAPPQGTARSGACRQACHAGGHAGRATQSRAVREFARHPPPRLAAWHARLRAPPQGAARKVEQAARLAMRAGTPAERHNPERYGSSNAIRRQDWRRGTQDCALHLKGPPAVEQAARLAMPAVVPAEPHNPGLCGSSHAIRRQDWRRGTQDCVLHLKGPPPLWGRLSSLWPAFQLAWAPFTHRSPCHRRS